MIKSEIHLPIFAHWRRYRERFGETFFSNEPEGLLCSFALIENTENLNHIRADFSKNIFR